jgi:hypothetical protein
MINARILGLVVIIYATAFLGSRFVAEVAIINSETIALAALVDFVRYCLVLLLIVSLCYRVSQDYELSQFERLLSMPISRYQYVLAQQFVLVAFVFLLVIPLLVLISWIGEFSLALYWSAALFMEMLLVGQFALLASISLEKLPLAIVFTIAIFLLAKASPLIELIFSQSSQIYEDEQGFKLAQLIFSWIQYLLPGAKAFAQNDILFEGGDIFGALWDQFKVVIIYGLFLQFVVLVDFYRKEFD